MKAGKKNQASSRSLRTVEAKEKSEEEEDDDDEEEEEGEVARQGSLDETSSCEPQREPDLVHHPSLFHHETLQKHEGNEKEERRRRGSVSKEERIFLV